MMDSDEELGDWDVDKYKTDYESEEHWEIRRAFMEKHKFKFEEDELVCMASVFTNIEFLGCRYPPETMVMVAELSKDVPEIEAYRKSRKNKLKRTFICASDACTKEGKQPKTAGTSKQSTKQGASVQKSAPKTVAEALKDIIYFDLGEDDVENKNGSINKTMSIMKKDFPMDLKFDAETVTYQYVFRGFVIGSGSGQSKKIAKAIADKDLIETLQNHCWTLKSKLKFFTMENIITREDQDSTVSTAKVSQIQSDNIGFKMLKQLGWKGGSLGSKNEGIIDPVSLAIKIGRLGLGSEGGTKFNIDYFKRLLHNYKTNDVEYDLVFANDFTKEERAQIHNIAQSMGLRTKSYGKDSKRHIVISSNIQPSTIKEKLLKGDKILQEKYDLIPPKLK